MTLGKRHLVGLVLLISLGLNILLGGMLIGGWASGEGHHGRGSWGFDREAARKAISPEAQKTVDDIRAAYDAKLREAFKAAREARQEIRRLLTADQIDGAALEAAQVAQAANRAAAQAMLAALQKELALALSPEERKSYFTAGAKRDDRRGPRHDEAETPPTTQQ
ncbi:MAG: periplasmic heavy metal sensor [Alphaproteobacteria bacterium]|nr:periplasmic heavy metal sensor [Alphaproteobacteria bacterium]